MQGAEIVNLCLELQDSIHEKDQHGKPAYLEKGYILVPRFCILIFATSKSI